MNSERMNWWVIAQILKGFNGRPAREVREEMTKLGWQRKNDGASSVCYIHADYDFVLKISYKTWLGAAKDVFCSIIGLQEISKLPAAVYWVANFEGFSACISERINTNREINVKWFNKLKTARGLNSVKTWEIQTIIEDYITAKGINVWDLHANNLQFNEDGSFVIFDYDCFQGCAPYPMSFTWQELHEHVMNTVKKNLDETELLMKKLKEQQMA